jgi:hypothetical protein
MTISSTTRTAGPFTGNGVAYLFPFAFMVFQVADVYVATVLIATGAESVLALGPGYTVALNANQVSNPGGTVILPLPLAVGYRLIVSSAVLNLQPTELLNQGGFYPEVLTAALDRATILIQQLQAYLNLTLQFPITDPILNNVLPSAEERAGMMLAFDSNGNPLVLAIAAAATVQGTQAMAGAVNGVNKSFTFTAAPKSTPLVFVAGIFQTPVTDYTAPALVSGSTWRIVFTVAPTFGPITVLQIA